MDNAKPLISGAVFCLCVAATALCGMTISEDFPWAFMLYGSGAGALIGLKTDVKEYGWPAMYGVLGALLAAMVLFGRQHVLWFAAMLFIALAAASVLLAKKFITGVQEQYRSSLKIPR